MTSLRDTTGDELAKLASEMNEQTLELGEPRTLTAFEVLTVRNALTRARELLERLLRTNKKEIRLAREISATIADTTKAHTIISKRKDTDNGNPPA